MEEIDVGGGGSQGRREAILIAIWQLGVNGDTASRADSAFAFTGVDCGSWGTGGPKGSAPLSSQSISLLLIISIHNTMI